MIFRLVRTLFIEVLLITLVVMADDKPRIAFIIDDFGVHPVNHPLMRKFAELDCPFAVAIIPGLAHSTELGRFFYEWGKEVIIHMPMESVEPSAEEKMNLTVNMSAEEIRIMVFSAIYDVPFAVGMSNHQGSLFTSDVDAMRKLSSVLADTTLFFIDSMTSPGGIAYRICRDSGVPAIKRDVFLDTDYNPGETFEQRMEQLLKIASSRGWAIGVGHRYDTTADKLIEFLASDEALRVEIVFPSELVDYKVYRGMESAVED